MQSCEVLTVVTFDHYFVIFNTLVFKSHKIKVYICITVRIVFDRYITFIFFLLSFVFKPGISIAIIILRP